MQLSSTARPTAQPARRAFAALVGSGLLVGGLALPGPVRPTLPSAPAALTAQTAQTAQTAATPVSAVPPLGASSPAGPTIAPPAAAGARARSTGSTVSPAASRNVTTAAAPTTARPRGNPLPSPGLRGPGTGLYRVASVPTGSWMPNGAVHALASDGTYVYLGGEFTALHSPTGSASGSYTRLARINLLTGVPDSTWTPTVSGTVLSLALNPSGSTLYLGGFFATVDGQPRSDLAAVSTTGSGAVTAFDPEPNGPVQTVLVDGNELVVGGAFAQIAGGRQAHLAKVLTSNGTLDGSFTPTVDGTVFTVARLPGQAAYAIGGRFTTVDTATRTDVAIVTSTAGAVTTWNPSTTCTATTGCPVYSIAVTTSQLFAAQGGPGGRLVAYSLTSAVTQWSITSDGDNQAVVTAGAELFVGGHFGPHFGAATRSTLAEVDAATGAVVASFAPTTTKNYPGTWALLVTPRGLVSGGGQLNFGGSKQAYFAIFTRASTVRQPPLGTRLGASGARP